MPRHFNTARRIDFVLAGFPKLRKRIEDIGAKYFQIRENWDYDIDYNGERWLVQTLARRNLLNHVFDVGANHGDWAAMVLAANPEVKIHCFEVCPPTFQKLAARFPQGAARPANIMLNSFGLSDSQSDIKVNYFPDGDAGSSIFDVLDLKNAEIINARVTRGKDYCAHQGLASIDLLKIDVEGAEHLVLRGFDDMLTPANIPVVQFEYGMASIVTKFLLRDFYDYFEKRGYKVGKLFPQSVRFREYRYQDENFLGPNYVAVSPQLARLLEP